MSFYADLVHVSRFISSHFYRALDQCSLFQNMNEQKQA